jgi:hypothetical protein
MGANYDTNMNKNNPRNAFPILNFELADEARVFIITLLQRIVTLAVAGKFLSGFKNHPCTHFC